MSTETKEEAKNRLAEIQDRWRKVEACWDDENYCGICEQQIDIGIGFENTGCCHQCAQDHIEDIHFVISQLAKVTRERDEAVDVLSKLCDFINREGPAAREW